MNRLSHINMNCTYLHLPFRLLDYHLLWYWSLLATFLETAGKLKLDDAGAFEVSQLT